MPTTGSHATGKTDSRDCQGTLTMSSSASRGDHDEGFCWLYEYRGLTRLGLFDTGRGIGGIGRSD